MKRIALALLLMIIPAVAFAWTHGAGTPPVITSVLPTSGGTAGGTPITIAGANFTGVTAIKFGATNAASFTCATSISCTATSPAGSGSENVTVVNGVGTSGGVAFLFQDFTQTFVAGVNDPNVHLIDGTELRDLLFTTALNTQPLPDGTTCAKVAGCPFLMGFTGFWQDNACAGGQGPQALAMMHSIGTINPPQGDWYLDKQFAGTASCGGASFNVVNSAYVQCVTFDGSGNAVSPCVQVVLVGGVQTGSGADFYARNNATGAWSTVATVGPANSALRTIADHEDDNTGIGAGKTDYAMLFNDTDGAHSATWLLGTPPAFAYTITSTPENFCQAWTSGTTCTTTCATNSVVNCTNLQPLWLDQVAVTSGSNASSLNNCTGTTVNQITLNWASGSALAAPLSPCASKVDIVGTAITCTGGTPPSGLVTVTAATSTSVTFASTGTTCTFTGAVVSTPANITVTWATPITAPTVPSTITISGTITGCTGANPVGTQTINMSSTTSLQFALDADCNLGSGGSLGAPVSQSITSWSSTVPSTQANSPTRIVAATDCPVTSGGNTAGKAQFLDVGMNIWQRVDKGTTSFWRIKGVIPYPSAGTANGQAQLRGMTCVVDSTKSGGWALLGHIEGDGGMWSMDPNTGIFNEEANLITHSDPNSLFSQWGWGAYGIDIYNSQGVVPITVGGKIYNIFGEGDAYSPAANIPWENTTSHITAFSGFWARATTSPASPSVPSYTAFPTSGTTLGAAAQSAAVLNAMAQSTPQPPAGGFGSIGFNACAGGGSGNCPLMISTRAGPVVSLFPEDAGQVLFFGGFDANSTAVHSTAWIGRAPVSMFSWP